MDDNVIKMDKRLLSMKMIKDVTIEESSKNNN